MNESLLSFPRQVSHSAFRVVCATAALLVAVILSGCASSAIVQPDGTIVRRYLGYVRVVVPQAEAAQPVYVSDVSTLGIRIGDGFGIGFLHDKQVVVPLDCRVVVLVATQKQLDDAVEKLSFFKGLPGFCAAVSPTLQPGGNS